MTLDPPEPGPAIALTAAGKRYVKYEDAPMLVTRALRVRGGTRRSSLWALRDATFAVERGESVGVIGRNGSGKSTLLRMVAGVTAPTEGAVRVRGRVAPLLSVGVGFHPELTGRENVYVNGTVLGLSRRDIDARFDDIVGFSELADFIDTPVKFYSSGMFVRLGFAVAVHAEPDVLLVDEVLAVGDIAFQLRSFDRMREIQASGTTLVVVSHNLNAVRVLCPRSLLVHDGAVRYDGDTTDAISRFHELLADDREELDGTVGPHAAAIRRATTIERFELVDGDGAVTSHVDAGTKVTVRFVASFQEDVPEVFLVLNVLTESGVQVYGETTVWRGPSSAGSGADVAIGLPLDLATGSYTVQVVLSTPEGVLLGVPPRALLFYVGGRQGVKGVADLRATYRVRRRRDDPAPRPSGRRRRA